jgi:UDP-galactopyranose mutase
MALPLAQNMPIEPLAVVYDCMDELSAFRFAPPELVKREAELLRLADVVFTGGRSLYNAKLGKHPNLHCFPSSVDVEHFAHASSTDEAADQRELPHPRFGWFGVIDERMDVGILDALAKAHPEWSIVMVGPVVKIDRASLPDQPNIYYLDSRTYDELPSYLAGWDVCIQPFALNESTRYISPTKTLEYMASGLPIVSTPITDVVDQYSHIVYLGGTPAEFIAACEKALAETPEGREARIRESRKVLAMTSWDNTASAMEDLIVAASASRSAIIA